MYVKLIDGDHNDAILRLDAAGIHALADAVGGELAATRRDDADNSLKLAALEEAQTALSAVHDIEPAPA